MKLKKKIISIISRIPSSTLRVFLYKNIYGYKIGKNVTIGKSYINCKKVIIEDNVVIGCKNIINCNELVIGNSSKIFSKNTIAGNSDFFLGNNSRIIDNHFFDLWSPIKIGNNTWIAGRDSQFWTHGSLKTKLGADLSIEVGNNVYISSGARVSPGVKIASNNLIGLGCVVNGIFNEENTIISNSKSVVVKSDINWKENW